MIKAGLIGLGKMGLSHYAILNAHPEVDLVAVCDTSILLQTVIEKYGKVKVYKDYKKMIKDCNLDCLVIATPTSLHKEMVMYALEKNIHVFVEKPFSLNYEDAREMTDLALSEKLVNQVGFHNRFIGVFSEVKRLLDKKAIGEVCHVRGEAYGPVVLQKKGLTWRSKKSEGGGCLNDYAAHVIDLINFMIGPADKVSGTILKKIYSQDVDDAVYSTLIYNNGITGQLSVNWSDETFRKMSTQIEIIGKDGKIIADCQECKIFLKNPGFENLEKGWNIKYTTDLTEEVWFYLRGEEYSAQIDYFIKCINNRQLDNINSFKSALETDVLIELLRKDAS